VEPDDRVTLRKKHPCGGFEWVVTRVGADIGLQCLLCGRRVMLARDEFERDVLKHQAAHPPSEPSLWEDPGDLRPDVDEDGP
jgi:hypothetical protein